MIVIDNLTFRMAGRVLLESAQASLPPDSRIGLVGRNGTGKTTLLRLLDGELAPDQGSIRLPNNLRIGRLRQHAPDGDEDLLTTVLAADRERLALLAEADHATDPHRIADIHTRLADIDAHSAPARAGSILAGLGFDAAAQMRSCKEFSGGWRLRIGLAALLFSAPDLLLLDEPTNHLDFEAVVWLEEFLRSYRGTIMIVSHDRQFLNRCVDHVLLLRDRKLSMYRGNYDQFEETRALQTAQQAALAARQEAQRKHMQSFIDRFRAKASKARQAQSRVKALARMVPVAVTTPEDAVTLSFPSPKPLASPIITLDGVAVGYEASRPVLRNLDLRIDQDDRIALLGANGNGKSTFLRLLAGGLLPQAGHIHRAPKLKIGYFDQHQTETLDLTATPLQILQRALPDVRLEVCRAHLARFGLSRDQAETVAGHLSGGERAKLLLALICREAPHLLLLDEPTNHLDMATREGLVEALNDYQGAVILVSHDENFLELSAERLWLVKDGTCHAIDQDLQSYKADLKRSDGNKQGRKSERTTASTSPAQSRDQVGPIRQKIERAEAAIAKLSAEKNKIEAALANPRLYQTAGDKVPLLKRELSKLSDQIADWEAQWLSAQDALERRA